MPGHGSVAATGPRFVRGVSELAPVYDTFVVDIWGVLIDGVRALAGRPATLARLVGSGAHVCLMTNASRSPSSTRALLEGMGFDLTGVAQLLTAGAVAQQRADALVRQHGLRGYWTVGRKTGADWLTELPTVEVSSPDKADLLIGLSVVDGGMPPVLRAQLRRAAAAGKHFVCADPDREVLIGGRRHLVSGQLAEFYETHGGVVHWCGKPDSLIYQLAREHPEWPLAAKVLVVGDSMTTDVAGARVCGWDVVLLLEDGVQSHSVAAFEPTAIGDGLLSSYGFIPTYVMPTFTW